MGFGGAREELYSQHPNEVDCTYYWRTSFCGFSYRCRFNHPRDCVAITILLLALKGFHDVIMCFYVHNFI